MFKRPLTFIGISAVVLVTSCSSWVESTRRSLLGSDNPREKKEEVKWVSKAQYDDLMAKYKNMADKYEKLKEEKLTKDSSFSQVDELYDNQQARPDLNAETVDVFGKNGLASQVTSATPPKKLNPEETDQELKYYKKAVALKENGKTDEALKIFQYLERSQTGQIRVRARDNIGNIYMQSNKFDLALQVYEQIITSDAFSGKVLSALENAVICCQKLGLDDKRLKYQSILRDFFEIQG